MNDSKLARPTADGGSQNQSDPNFAVRWYVLAIVGVAQLMVVLDATIVNIGLPSAQLDLGFSDDNRQWVISAYALAFGSLLLIGGRLGDIFGRKSVFIVGLLGFGVASVVGGAAANFPVLVAARAFQGMFGALLAPAAMAILSVTFTDDKERSKAFGIFGAIAGVGAGIGLLLGGILTDLASWRWCLYVNIVFAVPAAAAAFYMIRSHSHGAAGGHSGSHDIVGAVTATLGLFALVFGVSRAETEGWDSTVTLCSLVAAAVLLILFVVIETRVEQPLLPLRVVLNPVRGGSYFAIAVFGIVIFGVFLFLTFYLQNTLQYSPLKTGFAFMPLNLTMLVVVGVTSSVLLPKFGPRPLIFLGLLLAACGSALFALIDIDTGYVDRVLPALIVTGLGGGLLFATTFTTATLGIETRDTGVASAMLNVAQQVGGSIGIAVLSTIFGSAVADYAENNPGPGVVDEAALHGYTVIFWVAAGVTLVGSVISLLLIRVSRTRRVVA